MTRPENFLHFLAGVLVVGAVGFAALSLFDRFRTNSLRLSAIILLAALALFSNYWPTYFAAIFIIATAVTELEFLHILAAIIRGDKNYFDFRREFLTREEALKRTKQDVESESDIGKEDSSVEKPEIKQFRVPPSSTIAAAQIPPIALRLEERALEWFERKYGQPVQRYVRFMNATGQVVELDGAIEGKAREPDKIIEVKWIRNPQSGIYGRILDQIERTYYAYKNITNRDAELVLLLIVSDMSLLPKPVLAQWDKRISERNIRYRMVPITYADLDVEIENR